MEELFLHSLWRNACIPATGLKTTDGDDLEIVVAGEYNTNGGPDFLNAQIRIGGTLWAGNVEMHVHSLQWDEHGHQNDHAYNNVILHFVLHAVSVVKNKEGRVIKELNLSGVIKPDVLKAYGYIKGSIQTPPCSPFSGYVDNVLWQNLFTRMTIERIEQRMNYLKRLSRALGGNPEEVFLLWIARAFGFKVNGEPMELLFRSLSYRLIRKVKASGGNLEALLFGQAGFLDQYFSDDYPLALQAEFAFLRDKYSLVPLDSHLWKFLRMRPNNFPTVRLAQFADLLNKEGSLLDPVEKNYGPSEWKDWLKVRAGDYWKTHFHFGRFSPLREAELGILSRDLIFINGIVPFLFFYARQTGREEIKFRGMEILESIKWESNATIRKWKGMGIHLKSAMDSQGIMQLEKNYCSEKRCYDCPAGTKIFKTLSGT